MSDPDDTPDERGEENCKAAMLPRLLGLERCVAGQPVYVGWAMLRGDGWAFAFDLGPTARPTGIYPSLNEAAVAHDAEAIDDRVGVRRLFRGRENGDA